MISKDDLIMGRELQYPADYTQAISDNLDSLLGPINEVVKYSPYPMTVNSGWRPPAVNAQDGGAPHSKHMLGLAVDIADEDGSLWAWVLTRLDLMQEQGLYFEDKRWTKNWVHFQLGAPKSGKRVFIPNSSPAPAPTAWNGLYDPKYDRFPSATA